MGMIKTEEEINKLKKASKIADECFEFICNKIKIGMTEKEIAKYMDDYMLNNGATALSFETIVGSGENSSQIHSTPTDRMIQYGDIILLDFGCVVDGYPNEGNEWYRGRKNGIKSLSGSENFVFNDFFG